MSFEELKEHIIERDNLQEKSGFYKKYSITQEIDVTNCKTVVESAKKVMEAINQKFTLYK